MSFKAIRDNKILAKITESTVDSDDSDNPVQPPLSFESPNAVRSVA